MLASFGSGEFSEMHMRRAMVCEASFINVDEISESFRAPVYLYRSDPLALISSPMDAFYAAGICYRTLGICGVLRTSGFSKIYEFVIIARCVLMIRLEKRP